jgi:peptide deformylase
MKLVTIPNPILRKKAKKVTDFGKDLQDLINKMIEIMRDNSGIGLAAPQIGESLKLIVIEYEDKIYVMANPEIVQSSKEVDINTEGCLSIPDIASVVERSISVTIKGKNRYGKPIKVEAEGWLARVFQHEVDHINGVLTVEHAKEIWKIKKEEN